MLCVCLFSFWLLFIFHCFLSIQTQPLNRLLLLLFIELFFLIFSRWLTMLPRWSRAVSRLYKLGSQNNMELRKDFCFVAGRSYATVAAAADDSTEKNFSRKPEVWTWKSTSFEFVWIFENTCIFFVFFFLFFCFCVCFWKLKVLWFSLWSRRKKPKLKYDIEKWRCHRDGWWA